MQSPCEKAEIVEVIKVLSTRGNGKDEPFKKIIQYWTKDGKLISEKPSTH